MYIIKIGLVLLTGAGFGLGIDKLADTDILQNDGDNYYEHMDEGFCHDNGDFLTHMLADLTAEEQVLVQEKIDQLLVEYTITLEELNDDYDVRYDFMTDLIEFLELNEIDYHNNEGFDHHDDDDDWHGGMGMH